MMISLDWKSPATERGARGPALLVSVRDPLEAAKAAAGGADIIDLKEPLRGALGRADVQAIDDVAGLLASPEHRRPVSVALGELRDARRMRPWRMPGNVDFCKLGLAGLRDRADWRDEWSELRSRFDAAAGRELGWVAVAYADEVAAASPALDEVVEAAISADCRGLLVDTFDKRAGRLLDRLTLDGIAELAETVHEAGLFLAVAGRLRIEDLLVLRDLPVDVIGVRSAVCWDSGRSQRLSREQVTFCAHILQAATGVALRI
ncbi:MAG: hypothetical protein KF774_06490 [Planctomyces sp.]|nr:hypothetical protein [Planctomyces sp.]